MNKSKRCIVKNEKFEVDFFDEIAPKNCVLTGPNPFDKIYNYEMANGLRFKMSMQGHLCYISYEKNEVKTLSYANNFQFLADELNLLQNLNKSEIENLVIIASYQKEKAKLEITIEELKENKVELEREIAVYKEILSKKEDINSLVKKLQ